MRIVLHTHTNFFSYIRDSRGYKCMGHCHTFTSKPCGSVVESLPTNFSAWVRFLPQPALFRQTDFLRHVHMPPPWYFPPFPVNIGKSRSLVTRMLISFYVINKWCLVFCLLYNMPWYWVKELGKCTFWIKFEDCRLCFAPNERASLWYRVRGPGRDGSDGVGASTTPPRGME